MDQPAHKLVAGSVRSGRTVTIPALGGRLIAWTVMLTATLAFVSARSAPGQTPAARTAWSSAETQLRTSLLTGLNQVRARYGLGGLEIDQGLDESATAHSDEMLVDGYFGHLSADGTPFWERIERFYPHPAPEVGGSERICSGFRARSAPAGSSASGWRAEATARTSSPRRGSRSGSASGLSETHPGSSAAATLRS